MVSPRVIIIEEDSFYIEILKTVVSLFCGVNLTDILVSTVSESVPETTGVAVALVGVEGRDVSAHLEFVKVLSKLVPVVCLSSQHDLREKFVEAEVSFVPKPFRTKELVVLLDPLFKARTQN